MHSFVELLQPLGNSFGDTREVLQGLSSKTHPRKLRDPYFRKITTTETRYFGGSRSGSEVAAHGKFSRLVLLEFAIFFGSLICNVTPLRLLVGRFRILRLSLDVLEVIKESRGVV